MVTLTDRLDGIVGGKAAGLLDDVFGIRTVDDLMRHYPRKYIHGMSVWDEDEVPPEEGEHITLVGEIESAVTRFPQRGAQARVPGNHARQGSAEGHCDVLQREIPEKGLDRRRSVDALRRGRLLQGGQYAADPPGLFWC